MDEMTRPQLRQMTTARLAKAKELIGQVYDALYDDGLVADGDEATEYFQSVEMELEHLREALLAAID